MAMGARSDAHLTRTREGSGVSESLSVESRDSSAARVGARGVRASDAVTPTDSERGVHLWRHTVKLKLERKAVPVEWPVHGIPRPRPILI